MRLLEIPRTGHRGEGVSLESKGQNMMIYCCGCSIEVNARLIDGSEAYQHRPDLYDLPFWKCDTCGNVVGCHHKTNNPTRPLGVIATQEIKDARKRVHAIIDPLWKSKNHTRNYVYRHIGKILNKPGYAFHSAEIRSVEEAERVIDALEKRPVC